MTNKQKDKLKELELKIEKALDGEISPNDIFVGASTLNYTEASELVSSFNEKDRLFDMVEDVDKGDIFSPATLITVMIRPRLGKGVRTPKGYREFTDSMVKRQVRNAFNEDYEDYIKALAEFCVYVEKWFGADVSNPQAIIKHQNRLRGLK